MGIAMNRRSFIGIAAAFGAAIATGGASALAPVKRTAKRVVSALGGRRVHTWLGGKGSWDDPSMWSTGTVPGEGADVVIASGEVLPGGPWGGTLNSLTLRPGAKVGIAGNETVTTINMDGGELDIHLSDYKRLLTPRR